MEDLEDFAAAEPTPVARMFSRISDGATCAFEGDSAAVARHVVERRLLGARQACRLDRTAAIWRFAASNSSTRASSVILTRINSHT